MSREVVPHQDREEEGEINSPFFFELNLSVSIIFSFLKFKLSLKFMRYIIAIVFSIFSLGAAAQSGYFEDALRFSQSFPAGSARIMAIGGTQWSLGGDVSNIAGNPAGLGFFQKIRSFN